MEVCSNEVVIAKNMQIRWENVKMVTSEKLNNDWSDSLKNWHVSSMGRPNMIVCILGQYLEFAIFHEFFVIFPIFGQKISSETTNLIDSELGMEVYGHDFCQFCSNCGEICIIVFWGNFPPFWSKFFFSETTNPIDTELSMGVPSVTSSTLTKPYSCVAILCEYLKFCIFSEYFFQHFVTLNNLYNPKTCSKIDVKYQNLFNKMNLKLFLMLETYFIKNFHFNNHLFLADC